MTKKTQSVPDNFTADMKEKGMTLKFTIEEPLRLLIELKDGSVIDVTIRNSKDFSFLNNGALNTINIMAIGEDVDTKNLNQH